MKRTAEAQWKGDGLTGQGNISTQSGAFKKQPYSFKTRFESLDGKAGTNPEELLAAAHGGCFTMAVSFILSGAGFKPESLDTTTTVEIVNENGSFSISNIHLELTAVVPGISEDKFTELAEMAKLTCPLSKALASVKITFNAKLLN